MVSALPARGANWEQWGGEVHAELNAARADLAGRLSDATLKTATEKNIQSALASGPDVVWNGDSLSAQGGGSTPPVNPAGYLSAYTGKVVRTNAVGGETSVGVAARQGGNPYLLLPDGGSIPATGGVKVSLSNANGGFQWPLLQANGNTSLARVFAGSLAGIPGVLSITKPSGDSSSYAADDFYTFTRTDPGAAVTVNRPTAFYQDYAFARRGDIHIIQAGENDALNTSTLTETQAVEQTVASVSAMVEFLEVGNKRYLVLGVHNGTAAPSSSPGYSRFVSINARLQAIYGRRFVDYRKYLIQYGLADAGITPTSSDLADVSADTVPRSLLTDGLHFQLATRKIVAKLVGDRMVELKWLTLPGTAPAAPEQVPAPSVVGGDGVAELTWGLPADGGKPITDYIVEYKPASSGTWLTFNDGLSLTRNAAVTGLSNNTAYNFRVAAVNSVGTGPYSTIVSATTTAPSPVVVFDTFTAPDGTSINTRMPDKGITAWAGGFSQITNNRAGVTEDSFTRINTNLTNVIVEAELTWPALTTIAGIYARGDSAGKSGLLMYAQNQSLILISIVNGVNSTQLANVPFPGTRTVGAINTLKLSAIGDQIRGYVDGVEKFAVTLSADLMTAHSGLTWVGYKLNAAAPGVFDNFTASAV